MKQVSVIIPACNAEPYLEDCLSSIRAQSYPSIEIVVVDDASKDNTLQIAKRYADVVIHNEENLGEGASRNRGAKASKGEILVQTDADIVAPTDWVAGLVKAMEEKNVVCVGGGYKGSIGESSIERFGFLELEHRRRHYKGFVNTLVSNNFACCREVYFEIGGFPENFKAEDMRLSYQISKKYRVWFDQENGVFHNFRKSYLSYFRQQFYFARDTAISFIQFPELIYHKTHQGRSLYAEVMSIILTIVSVSLGLYIWALFFLVAILVINIPFLSFCFIRKLSPWYVCGMVLLRDFCAAAGIVAAPFSFLTLWRRGRTKNRGS